MVAGTACMFSSTIVGLKLLPTTVLHHRHIGELVVSLLLIQDLIAILALIILSGRGTSVTDALGSVIEVFVALPSLVIVAFVRRAFRRTAADPQVRRISRVHLSGRDRLVPDGRQRARRRSACRSKSARSSRASRWQRARSRSTSPRICDRCAISFS